MDFVFGIDSIILTNFANKIRPGSTICDLGTGTGIISILLSKKIDDLKIIAFEKQENVCNMALRSVKLNGLENRISIINLDILNIDKSLKVDAVVTNPPYKKMGTGINSYNLKRQISRFESSASLNDWIEISSNILKDFGEFYMVYRPERLVEVFNVMSKYNIEPKEIRFVHSRIGEKATMVLIKGIKFGREFLKVKDPLIVYNENRSYTSEIDLIYNGEE